MRNHTYNKNCWLLLLLPVVLSACSSRVIGSYTWAWWIVSPFTKTGQENLLFLLSGLLPTVWISASAFAISIPLGFIIALLSFIPAKIAKSINRLYVEVIRSVPALVLILWVYYGLPVSLGINLDVFTAGMVALAISDSAFEAEIFRAGIQSTSRVHLETARSLGLTRRQTLRYVIMPQAIRRILPPLGNQFVYMLKISSLVSMIGYQELTRRARELTTVEFSPLEIFTVLIVEYLILILVVSFFVHRMERNLRSTYSE